MPTYYIDIGMRLVGYLSKSHLFPKVQRKQTSTAFKIVLRKD